MPLQHYYRRPTMKLSDAIGLALERREKDMTFEEWWPSYYEFGDKWHSDCAKAAWDYQQARIEALEKDFAYHSELCTIQQARIGALREALKLINDRAGHGLGVSDVWLVAVTGKALQPEQEGEL